MNSKVLMGKDNYLFLINDSANSLNRHTKNCNPPNVINNKIKKKKNYFIIIFPDKEIICEKFLPNNLKIKYRSHLDIHKKILHDNVIDPTKILEPTDYYKTDSHINGKGSLKVYKFFIEYLNKVFNTNIKGENIKLEKIETASLHSMGKGIGDLTWESNKGNLLLNDISDIYYSLPEEYNFYMTWYSKNDKRFKILNSQLIDTSDKHHGWVSWNLISTSILYNKSENAVIDKKVIFFYDSFLLQSIGLYKDIFKELYLIKNVINPNIINKIKPDFIFEFRAERFLL